ncbi:MAG TPA: aspartate aminotransferase family protein [Chloroflexota bacterium]|nr:aspartate aminotransferase family protein [Chloroflexota bacterium]
MPLVTEHWQELEQQYYMRTFTRQPVVLIRGEGARVWDESGKGYLDMVAGLAVNVLGHCHPAVVEAITRQARQLIHTTNLYYTTPQLELAKLLIDNSCADRIFFGNSGAEANEGAIKLARKWGHLHRNGAYGVITATDSFHGRTLATLAATGQPKYHKPFAPMPDGFASVEFNDLAALKAATGPETCAVMLEVVQGESGIHLADHDYLVGVRRWCDEQGLLLIFDEIQSGLGRTGKFLSFEHHGVEPDVFTLAKGLAGGVPIGAFLAKEACSVLTAGDHGSTFGGGPLACAAGVATIKTIFGEDLAGHSAEIGGYLMDQLRVLQVKHEVVETVRGLGLMVAFDLKTEQAASLVAEALKRGLILNPTGPRTVRMVPPLIIGKAEVDEAIATIDTLLAAL